MAHGHSLAAERRHENTRAGFDLFRLLAGRACCAEHAGLGARLARSRRGAGRRQERAQLVAEIERELKQDGLKANRVICIGARHGNQWKYLGGARAAPYSCVIGKRELTIEADCIYYDAQGRSLGDVEHASFTEAKTFRQTNFRWTWKQAEGGG